MFPVRTWVFESKQDAATPPVWITLSIHSNSLRGTQLTWKHHNLEQGSAIKTTHRVECICYHIPLWFSTRCTSFTCCVGRVIQTMSPSIPSDSKHAIKVSLTLNLRWLCVSVGFQTSASRPKHFRQAQKAVTCFSEFSRTQMFNVPAWMFGTLNILVLLWTQQSNSPHWTSPNQQREFLFPL